MKECWRAGPPEWGRAYALAQVLARRGERSGERQREGKREKEEDGGGGNEEGGKENGERARVRAFASGSIVLTTVRTAAVRRGSLATITTPHQIFSNFRRN